MQKHLIISLIFPDNVVIYEYIHSYQYYNASSMVIDPITKHNRWVVNRFANRFYIDTVTFIVVIDKDIRMYGLEADSNHIKYTITIL